MFSFFSSRYIISFIISLSFFMEALDSTVINTAIPAMAHGLHVEAVDLKIALISYLLSLAMFIPISGWLADKFGTKNIFMFAMLLFTLSSLWCGFAQTLPELIVVRFFQGVGGALGIPVGRLIVIRTFGHKNLIATMNHVVTIGALGMLLGPLLGGVITHFFSWHWIFWINVPMGLLTLVLAMVCLDSAPPIPTHPLDKWGFLFFGLALSGLTFGLSALSETTVKDTVALLILAFSLLFFLIYAWHSRYQAYPIVKTKLLALRTFRLSIAGNLLTRLGFGGVPFLLPLLLQIGLGFAASISGLLLAPMALGVLLAKSFSLPILRRFGYKRTMIVNTLLAGFSIMLFAVVDEKTSLYTIGFCTLLYGGLMSLQYSALNSLAYAEISSENLSAATSITGTLQQIAQSFGVAISAIFIRVFATMFSHDLVLTPHVFHDTFLAIGSITMLSAWIYRHLQPGDGKQMIG